MTLDTPWNPANEFDEDTGVAPADIRDIYQFATKYIMLYDDAELQDPIIAEAEAQLNDSYTTWTARINQLTSKVKNVDWEHLIPCFAWQPQSVIEKTLENTTQYYRTTSGRIPMRKYFKTRTPALRVTRLAEKVSTDFIDSSVPSINGGQTGAQIFYGCDSHMINVFGVHSKSEFPDVLMDFLIERGAPHTLMSDSANEEASAEVKRICRKFQMKQRYSEPYKQNQNRVEREIQNLKRDLIKVLDRTGAPDNSWLYCLKYLGGLHNCTALEKLGWITPTQKSTGIPADISIYTKYHFHQPVYYYAEENNSFPQTKELLGYWWGPNENTGDAFCSNILTLNGTVIPRSTLRPAYDQPLHTNKRQVDGEDFLTLKDSTGTIIQSHNDNGEKDETVPDIEPESLIGYEFIHKIDENGYRAKVIEYFPDQK